MSPMAWPFGLQLSNLMIVPGLIHLSEWLKWFLFTIINLYRKKFAWIFFLTPPPKKIHFSSTLLPYFCFVNLYLKSMAINRCTLNNRHLNEWKLIWWGVHGNVQFMLEYFLGVVTPFISDNDNLFYAFWEFGSRFFETSEKMKHISSFLISLIITLEFFKVKKKRSKKEKN